LRGKGPSYLWKGLSYKTQLRREGVNLFHNVTDIALQGETEVTDIAFTSRGRKLWLSAGVVALHEGVIPAQQIARALGCTHDWDPLQHCFRPRLDDFGNTTLPGVLIAGDGGGIGGARAAEHSGRLAAAEILFRINILNGEARDALALPERRGLAAHLAVRPFLDRLFAPAPWVTAPADDVVVCRCEEVTAGAIRAAVTQGAQGPNQAKAFLRAGMGPCQGRMCGPLVSEIMATALHRPVDDVGYQRVRPPLKPITVGELAAVEEN
jgi:NADPH-dependent 2,4-dienoyl-CoA reductase/sulfur reductase-like enzyme